MRTNILSMTMLHTQQMATIRSEANTCGDAIDNAEKAHPGFLAVVTHSLAGEHNNATVNR
ncbi:hypothetical protein [Pseudomonas aeruginosa]|uniref:hypothetical protein n=1 Tax=Pseudomonas aeruginosa TaxID=287 RepID=UPI001E2A9CCA|nr:hypothetical protein [Pseudomonas aeruginosa]MCC9289611.1 hypothetical protein [Pseudomonas aeruginosa]UVN18859.1 Hypothetical protein [Pseudomonas aeruginosa]